MAASITSRSIARTNKAIRKATVNAQSQYPLIGTTIGVVPTPFGARHIATVGRGRLTGTAVPRRPVSGVRRLGSWSIVKNALISKFQSLTNSLSLKMAASAPAPIEKKLPTAADIARQASSRDFDVIIVGGGAAGMQAALSIGRGRRRVLLLSDGDQANLPAHEIGGLLGAHHTSPADLYAVAKKQLAELPSVQIMNGLVTDAKSFANHATVTVVKRTDGAVTDSSTLSTRRLFLAMGAAWTPDYVGIDGLKPFWGNSVFHCPFCHGWEVRDEPIAVLQNGPMAGHRTVLMTQWSKKVTLLTNGPSTIPPHAAAEIAVAGVPIDERKVADVILSANGKTLEGIRFEDGTVLAVKAVMIGGMPNAHPHAATIARQLNLTTNMFGLIITDKIGRTSTANVWAVGDAAGPTGSVAGVTGQGSVGALMLLQDLLNDDWYPGTTAAIPPMFTQVLPADQVHQPPTAAAETVAQPAGKL